MFKKESIGKQLVNFGDVSTYAEVLTDDWQEGTARHRGETVEVEYLYDLEGRKNHMGYQLSVWRKKEQDEKTK